VRKIKLIREDGKVGKIGPEGLHDRLGQEWKER
jgi:hypothetical protein